MISNEHSGNPNSSQLPHTSTFFYIFCNKQTSSFKKKKFLPFTHIIEESITVNMYTFKKPSQKTTTHQVKKSNKARRNPSRLQVIMSSHTYLYDTPNITILVMKIHFKNLSAAVFFC